ncbi:MAG TPA: 5'/3'-nucleotidase SurE [Dehalococcoidales bacterium]|nr:5'/3'-nucleotidase SurE [Dehalococcoidales bacterium]
MDAISCNFGLEQFQADCPNSPGHATLKLVRILISNDDGIYSDGIWALAREIGRVAEVMIVAPDREQSAVGTAVSLRKPLRVQQIVPLFGNTPAFSVEGTPSDSVIVGLGKIAPAKIDMVVSGINQGTNLGEDVLISGTVGAALAAYLRGFPAMAVSCPRDRWSETYLNSVARFTARLARRVQEAKLPVITFLNVNFPDVEISEIKGVKVAGLAHRSHVNSVEEGHDGKKTYYLLTRAELSRNVARQSDIGQALQGNITVTPLNLFLNDRLSPTRLENVLEGLLEEFRREDALK